MIYRPGVGRSRYVSGNCTLIGNEHSEKRDKTMFNKGAKQVRIVTEAFSGTGIDGNPGRIFTIAAGVSAPPALLQNSEPYDGPIPHDAIHYGKEGHRAYIKANTARPEPPATVWMTEADVKKNQGWSDSQFAAAKASGFPQSNGRRDRFDRDGVPAGSEPLWSSELVQNWANSIRTLTVSGR